MITIALATLLILVIYILWQSHKINMLKDDVSMFKESYDSMTKRSLDLEIELGKVNKRYEGIYEQAKTIDERMERISDDPIALCDIANRRYTNHGESDDSDDIIEGEFTVSNS